MIKYSPNVHRISLNKRRDCLIHENNKRRGAYSKQYGIHILENFLIALIFSFLDLSFVTHLSDALQYAFYLTT